MRKILPEMHQEYAELETQLQRQAWQQASRQAHKLLSMVKLLGLDELLPLLLQIEAAHPCTQTETFRLHLQQTYQTQLASLSTY